MNKDNTLKKELCQELIDKGLCKPFDVIKHSYTGQIMGGNKKCIECNNIMPTLTTRPDCLGVCVKVMKSDTPKVLFGIGEKKSNSGTQYYEQNRVYDGSSIACCINASINPYYAIARERESKMSKDKINVVGNYTPSGHSGTKVCGTNGLAPTVMENHSQRFAVENQDLTIRKITEKECMLLMGFDSEDYKAMKQAGLSTQAIAHIAGDSIVTTCIVSLLSPLIKEEDEAHASIIEQYVDHIVETRNN